MTSFSISSPPYIHPNPLNMQLAVIPNPCRTLARRLVDLEAERKATLANRQTQPLSHTGPINRIHPLFHPRAFFVYPSSEDQESRNALALRQIEHLTWHNNNPTLACYLKNILSFIDNHPTLSVNCRIKTLYPNVTLALRAYLSCDEKGTPSIFNIHIIFTRILATGNQFERCSFTLPRSAAK